MYRVKQDGMVVAQADTRDQAMHYALMYLEDGPVEVESKRKKGGRWVTIMSMKKLEQSDGE